MANLKVRPSKMALTRACRGSVAKQAPYPWEDSPAANRGRALHDAMALLFQMPEAQVDEAWKVIRANKKLDPKDVEALPEVYRIGRSQEPDSDDVILEIEKSLDLTFIGMDGGKPDLAYISKKLQGAVIIDWKFGGRPVEDPEQNAQMQDYGIGLLARYPELEFIEGIIIQPFGNDSTKWYRSHTWSKEELQAIAEQDQQVAAEAKTPGAPIIAGPHCDNGFCSARKEALTAGGVRLAPCEAYLAYAQGKKDAKARVEAKAVAEITQGEALVIAPDLPLQTPTIVINAATIAEATQKRAQALSLKVVDAGTAMAAGNLSKDLRGLYSLIDRTRKATAKPFYDFFKKINGAAEAAMGPLEEGAKHLDEQVSAFMRAEADKIARVKAEEERKRREAEQAAAQAAADEQRQKDEMAATLRRQQEAELAAANAKGKKAKEEAERQAAEARRLAEEEQAKMREAEAARQEADRKALAAEMRTETLAPAPTQVAGFRQAVEVTSSITDITKVPKQWISAVLVVDQKALDNLVKLGKLTEEKDGAWLTITRKTVAVRAR